MCSTPYHVDTDNESSFDDAIEHVMPWIGGDIFGAELGYSFDGLAELNEHVRMPGSD